MLIGKQQPLALVYVPIFMIYLRQLLKFLVLFTFFNLVVHILGN